MKGGWTATGVMGGGDLSGSGFRLSPKTPSDLGMPKCKRGVMHSVGLIGSACDNMRNQKNKVKVE